MDIFVHFSCFFFIYNFACVNANCINFGSGVYFYWNFNIPPSLNLFYTRYTKLLHSGPFGQKCDESLYQDESLYVLPNCKSLWIKASAK